MISARLAPALHPFNQLLIAASLLLAAACASPEGIVDTGATAGRAGAFAEKAKDMTIYEVNIRQHTPEGTFKAFQQHLPRLKELGADILWIMPVQPIGELDRKGSLGSYYSIKDYTSTNPEFGSLQDFKELVQQAHALGMYVILDWVPNHTAWDHAWMQQRPDYYMTDSAAAVVGKNLGVAADYYKTRGSGKLVYESNWDDIALLNLYQPATRQAMIEAMRFWITEADIDGFRADHAGHEIPLFFWEEAAAALNPLKELFWLAEWDEPRMHLVFHASYDWGLLHLTERVARGRATADDLHEHIRKDLAAYGQGAYRLNMITNHDENSWSGTIRERYGEGADAFAVFSFTAYGMPMLYSGQEAGLNKRLRFFDKDTISWEDPTKYGRFYGRLNQLKAENQALWSGPHGGMPEKLEDGNPEVFSFRRSKGGNTVIGIFNLSANAQRIQISEAGLAGSLTDTFSGSAYQLDQLELAPWQYLLFVQNE
ncbi:alpha-amylase family glycosyl hydrolase [Cesiribacter andamanensis]|uniref:Alpha-amylase 2 n=1 Tax=Cesiribacter andamanensis AMV16 TaxID=1279009 RepID=M7N4V3_9BACT|nr:alpha-amylase family glycosyl hydrolase [Cesiribacter andamanensis]EMR02322.1 Alpha-amylase 2 [Cesiribacter andamanensis AMV16]